MMENLPLQADQATSASIARRIGFIIRAEEPNIAFAWQGLSEYARRHAMAWAAIREGQRMLDELGCVVSDALEEMGRGLAEDENLRTEQHSALGDELAAWPEGTKPL